MGRCRLLAILFLSLAVPVFAKDKWIEVQTKHFRLISSAGGRQTRELAVQLEQFRFVVGKLFSTEPPAMPVTIVVFRSDAAFNADPNLASTAREVVREMDRRKAQP